MSVGEGCGVVVVVVGAAVVVVLVVVVPALVVVVVVGDGKLSSNVVLHGSPLYSKNLDT